ncbi:MAG: nuclear transport factor 2 family protein [Acidobacteriota bacterium]
MKKIIVSISSLAILGLAALSLPQAVSRTLQKLIQAERDFAATSAAAGIREAFLSFLAPDAIVFRPKPMPGKPTYEQINSASPVLLSWEPIYAEASRAGDLGYTTGPYEVKERNSPNPPSGYGHYVSLWKKQPDGLWKVILDAGVRHSRPASGPGEMATREGDRRAGRGRVDPLKGRSIVIEAEREFVEKANQDGLVPAYLFFAADDIRIYRDGSLPEVGKKALSNLIKTASDELLSEPMDAEASSSGDLGYAYGIAEWKTEGAPDTAGRSQSFLRIWRKSSDGRWKIVLDLAVPITPPRTD